MMLPSKITARGGAFHRYGHDEWGRSEIGSQEWVIVGSAPKIQRSWYKGGYVEGSPTSPQCWSNDGRKPDTEVEDAPSVLCMTCDNDIKGSGKGYSKACKHSLRLAVLMPEELDGVLYRFVLSSPSIFGKSNLVGSYPYNAYTEYLARYELSVSHVVTKATIEPDSQPPKVQFKSVRALTPEEYKVVSLRSKESGEATKLKVVKDSDFSIIS